MKITFEDKINPKDHILIVYENSVNDQIIRRLDKESESIVKSAISSHDKSKEKIELYNYSVKNKIKSISLAKFIDPKNAKDSWKLEAFGGKLLTHLEKINASSVSLIVGDSEKESPKIFNILNGIDLKSYSIDKYKTITKKKYVNSIKVVDLKKILSPLDRKKIINKQNSK